MEYRVKVLQSTWELQHLECCPLGVPFHTPLQLALRNPAVECDLNPQSKMTWIFGVAHSAECHSKSPGISLLRYFMKKVNV